MCRCELPWVRVRLLLLGAGCPVSIGRSRALELMQRGTRSGRPEFRKVEIVPVALAQSEDWGEAEGCSPQERRNEPGLFTSCWRHPEGTRRPAPPIGCS